MLQGGGINVRVLLEADKVAPSADGRNSGGAAAGADVRYQLPRLGIGLYQVFAQRNRLLGGVDAVGVAGIV